MAGLRHTSPWGMRHPALFLAHQLEEEQQLCFGKSVGDLKKARKINVTPVIDSKHLICTQLFFKNARHHSKDLTDPDVLHITEVESLYSAQSALGDSSPLYY